MRKVNIYTIFHSNHHNNHDYHQLQVTITIIIRVMISTLTISAIAGTINNELHYLECYKILDGSEYHIYSIKSYYIIRNFK